MEQYKGWDVYEKIPDGWEIDKYSSPMPYSRFIVTKGNSPLTGQKRAILKVTPSLPKFEAKEKIEPIKKDLKKKT